MAATTAPKKKRGRPSKADIAAREKAALAREKAEKKAERERVEALIEELPPVFKCTRCGKQTLQAVGNFYTINNNVAFDGNENRASICIECTNKFLAEYREKYQDEKLAVMLVCMHLGTYFSEPLYDAMHEKELNDPINEYFQIGKYLRQLNGPQYGKKTNFLTYMISLLQRRQAFKQADDEREVLESAWRAKDKQNKQTCIREIGYDCFDDSVYSSNDRRQMFSSLAQYLTMGDIAEDKHKRDAAISIVKAAMQQDYLDRELNREYRNPDCDYSRVDKIIGAKKQLADIIIKTAKENGISMGTGSKRGRSATAVTAIMKEMIDNGVIEAKVNLTDVKMTEAFQSIANISAKALLGEMNITGDEYAIMVGKQSEIIRDYEKQIAELQEEVRLLTIKVNNYEAPRQRFQQHPVDVDIGAAARQRELEEEERRREEEADRNFQSEFEGLRNKGDNEC